MQALYYCPVLTAFAEDGSFDAAAQHALYDSLLAAGIDGVVVLGSSGEFYALSYDECREVGFDAVSYIAGRMDVYVGTGRLSADETVRLSNEMVDAGATGVIVVGPYYIGASEEGVFAFFDAVAKGVHGDILIYNYPERTGYDVAPVLPRLAAADHNVVGVKDTVESATHTQRIVASMAEVRPGFKVFSGFDNNLVPVVMAGGTGVIAAISNMAPELCAAWVRSVREEDFAEVARIHKKVCGLMGIYSATTPFMPAMKHVLGLQGRGMTDVVRLPAVRVSEREAALAKEFADAAAAAEGECHV